MAEILLAGLSKLRATVSEFFKGQKLSHQMEFFPPVPDFELMIYGIKSRNFRNSSKLHSTCPEEHSAKTLFRNKNSTLSEFQEKLLRISVGKCLEVYSEGTKLA